MWGSSTIRWPWTRPIVALPESCIIAFGYSASQAQKVFVTRSVERNGA